MDWVTKNWSGILAAALGIVLGAAILGAISWISRLFRRERRAWFVAAALLVLSCYVFVWLRYALFRIYITPVLTLTAGFAAGLGWSSRRAWWHILFRQNSLVRLAQTGDVWSDSLQTQAYDKTKWQLVESDPPGMITATPEGLAVSWGGGPPGYENSGFLVAQLELDEGDFCVEFQARLGQYGTGWDAGVHLLLQAAPKSKACAALRFLPAPYTKVEHNGLCLLSDDQVRYAFKVPAGEWVTARLEVSGSKCRATVGGKSIGWCDMGVRPGRLVVGSTPVDWHAEGTSASYGFRNVRVRPRHMG